MTGPCIVDAVLIVGVGNPDRGDDGLGALAARRLSDLRIPGVRVICRSADILGLAEEWRAAGGVILIDAAQSETPIASGGRVPVHRIDVSVQPLPKSFAGRSTHGFGIAEAVELARALGTLPRRIIVYAVEGRRFDMGAPLSPEVAASMDGLVARVGAEARSMTSDTSQAGRKAEHETTGGAPGFPSPEKSTS